MPRFFCLSFSPPNDKKSFCSIEGEWNGVMFAKWATGVSLSSTVRCCDHVSHFYSALKKCLCAFQENTVFIDTKKLGIIKKKVRKLEDQLDHESRR